MEKQLKRALNQYSKKDRELIESKLWAHPDNYCGPDYPFTIGVVGQSRDSETLEQSNFECVLADLGGESKHVLKVGASHWACGWVETIRVDIRSKRKTLKALEIIRKLQDYPVYDESDFCDRKSEAIYDYAEYAQKDLTKALTLHFGIKGGNALKEVALQLNIEDQHMNGTDSCINLYSGRAPDERDLRQLKDALKSMGYSDYHKKNKAFITLCQKLGVELK